MQEMLHPTPMERAILDFLIRMERQHAADLVHMEERLRACEQDNIILREQVAALKQTMSDCADSLDSFLAPLAMPQS